MLMVFFLFNPLGDAYCGKSCVVADFARPRFSFLPLHAGACLEV
jgi:hypothetical protein